MYIYVHTYSCNFLFAVEPKQQTAQEDLDSSDSEEERDADGDAGAADGAAAEEDAERREEERVQKLWVKRAKRRRVLAEVEQSGAGGNSQGAELLMQEASVFYVGFGWWGGLDSSVVVSVCIC